LSKAGSLTLESKDRNVSQSTNSQNVASNISRQKHLQAFSSKSHSPHLQ
jgi:hypothetical protein